MSDEDINTDAAGEVEDVVEEAVEDTGATPDEDSEQEPDGADDLGDKGKRALNEMKGKWRSERDKRRALEARLAEIASAQSGGKAEEGAAEQAVRDAEKAATAKANTRILRSEVRAAAAGKLSDPKDALQLLDLSQFEVDDDGAVDEDEIAEAIGDLLKRKPYLGVAQSGGQRFEGTGDGGRRGQKAPTIDQQIAEAQASGDWKAVMHLNNQKLAAQAAAQK